MSKEYLVDLLPNTLQASNIPKKTFPTTEGIQFGRSMSTQAHAQGPRSTSLTLMLVLKSFLLCAPVPMGESPPEPLPWQPDVTFLVVGLFQALLRNKLQKSVFFHFWNVISKRCSVAIVVSPTAGSRTTTALYLSQELQFPIPLDPCMVYLPTFNIKSTNCKEIYRTWTLKETL